jgi:hypothetical protein
MKAIVIAEMDEKLFDELSKEDLSMRLLWDFDIMWEHKSKYFDHVILRPLPKKSEMTDDWKVADLIETESGRMARCYFKGRNEVIDEILGETEWVKN